MTEAHDIISDEEIARVHANANFGSMTPREVVNDGVQKYAVGYQGGSTQVAILREHGLISKPKNYGYKANLTEKGKRYARAIYHDTLRAEIARLTASYREACEQRDTLQADVWRLREAVEIADARFAEHGMETMTARLEEYGYDHEAEMHQLATYRAALAHGEVADQ
jgi:hypothetical protein